MGRAGILSATWRPPEAFDRDRLLETFHRLRRGTAPRVDGFWRARDVRGSKRVEFATQYIAIGDEPPVP